MRSYLILLSLVLAVLCLFGALLSDVFLSWPNFLNILTASSTIGLLAIGAAFIIGAGGIDLSVGSLVALSAVVATYVGLNSCCSFFTITFLCLASGTVAGMFNGFLIGRWKLPPFIVTLGMLSFARGLALIITDGRPVYGLPEEIVFLGQGELFGIPVPALIFLASALLCHLALERTQFGRHCLAIGDNEKAARDAGIRVTDRKILIYGLSGTLAAIGGLLTMGRTNAADPSAGSMYELTAITAAIIGGTALQGGRASVIGAVLGAVIIGVLQNGLTLVDLPAYYQQLAVGAVLILAVASGQWRGVHAARD